MPANILRSVESRETGFIDKALKMKIIFHEKCGLRALAFLLLLSECGFGSVADDLQFETSAFMKRFAYQHPDQVAADLAPSGAQGRVNMRWDQDHTGKWYIEEQRSGADAICAGIAQQDKAAVERGLKILRWGFEQQQSDGSFNCPDAFHSTSFFVEASAHACLLLNASSFAESYAEEINWIKPRVLKAALWMTEPAVELPGRKHNLPYTHRRYLVAAAFGETGVLTGNRFLIDKSKEYIRDGISLQDPSGYNPEKGGYDCSYHAVGLVFAERYYDLVADAETKEKLLHMLTKAIAWLQSRVLPDGTIDASGNTRTGMGQELGRLGEVKKVSYSQIYRAFYRWSLISADPSFERLAEEVHAGQEIYRKRL
jgi:hypothetical protein